MKLAAEIKKRKVAEQALQDLVCRTKLQLAAVGQAGQEKELLTGDVDGLARKLTELAAEAIGCERVNDDNETRLRCIDLFEATPATHSAGLTLRESEYRHGETYLKPLRITSMFDTVIEVSGKHLGLLCFEHVDRPHRWEQDEISFAGHLADKLALALISRVRRQSEGELRASEGRFRSIYNSVSDAIIAHDILTGVILDVNARARDLTLVVIARSKVRTREPPS